VRAWIQGKDIRKSTGERTLAAATRVATEWWQDLSVCARRGDPRVRRQRLALFWFILICVGGALRVGEAESVRWKDCDLVRLNNGTEKGEPAVRMMVLGKHSTGGQREEAYVLFGGAPHAG
jgi:integrase